MTPLDTSGFLAERGYGYNVDWFRGPFAFAEADSGFVRRHADDVDVVLTALTNR